MNKVSPRHTRSFRCWAAACGDCAGGPSAEHLLSKALFPAKTVYVSGFNWCQGETVAVGINSLTRQILCVKHNNALSAADATAAKAVSLFQAQSAPPPLDAPRVDRDIDGHEFERWLLKTAINLSVDDSRHIGVGMTGSAPGLPSAYLLEVAFGRLQFTHLLGAHFLIPEGEAKHNPSEIIVMPVVKGNMIGGFYFELRSQAVFLNLFPGHAPESLGAIADLPLSRDLLFAKLVYRPPRIATAVDGIPTGLVRFHWRGPET